MGKYSKSYLNCFETEKSREQLRKSPCMLPLAIFKYLSNFVIHVTLVLHVVHVSITIT